MILRRVIGRRSEAPYMYDFERTGSSTVKEQHNVKQCCLYRHLHGYGKTCKQAQLKQLLSCSPVK